MFRSGETGSGKSTQIPQYILDDALEKGNNNVRIVVTQPRRISAITLAERVADERGGKVGDMVGYSIRTNPKYSKKTKLIFVTTGVLLRWLSSETNDMGLTHIVLDEVHERDKYSDFLLIMLKSMLKKKSTNLKLILMSATIQTEKFVDYFDHCPHFEILGRMFPVLSLDLGQTLLLLRKGECDFDMTNEDISDEKYTCSMCGKNDFKDAAEFGIHVATCFGNPHAAVNHQASTKASKAKINKFYGGNVHERVANQLSQYDNVSQEAIDDMVAEFQEGTFMEMEVDVELVVKTLQHIEDAEYGPGAVLVFLPGWKSICQISEALMEHPVLGNANQFKILSLHSSIPSQEQRLVFQNHGPRYRKIVLATNIAETSITIDDVVYVIDTGYVKLKSYNVHMQMSTLQTSWISQASAKQRSGRAGRVSSGICFRLYSRQRFDEMEDFHLPELLRTPLAELALQVKVMQQQELFMTKGGDEISTSIENFLMAAPDPPELLAITTALERLVQMGALLSDESLTMLGYKLAQLPMDPGQGKMLLLAHLLGCFNPMIQLSAFFSYKDPFVLPTTDSGKRAAKLAIKSLTDQVIINGTSKPLESDCIVLLNALSGYRRSNNRSAFCRSHFLAPSVLSLMGDLERQLFSELSKIDCHPPSSPPPQNIGLLLAVIAAGQYPNLVYRMQRQSKYTTRNKLKVTLHPSSAINAIDNRNAPTKNAKNGYQWLVYDELVMTDQKLYMHTGSLVTDFALLLLVGETESFMINDDTIHLRIDNWFEFMLPIHLGEFICILRRRVRQALQYQIDHPGGKPTAKTQSLIQLVQFVFATEVHTDSTNTFTSQSYHARSHNSSARSSIRGFSGRGQSYRGQSHQVQSHQSQSYRGQFQRGRSYQAQSHQAQPQRGQSHQVQSNRGRSYRGQSQRGRSYRGQSNRGQSNRGQSNRGQSNRGHHEYHHRPDTYSDTDHRKTGRPA